MLVRHQTGISYMADLPGTTIIRYTSPTGVSFSEWIMYVDAAVEELKGSRK